MSPELLAWLLAAPVVALVHETGHALAARPAGYRLSSFGVGLGAPLLRWRTSRGAVLYLGRWFFAGGACAAIPVDPVPQRRWLYDAGGVLAQAVLALVMLPMVARWPALNLAAWLNVLVLVFNLLPWRVGGSRSDGWLLMRRRTPGLSGGLHASRAPLEQALAQQERLRAPLGVVWCRLMLQWLELLVGLPHGGRDASAGQPVFDLHVEALQTYICAERHRVEGRPLAGLRALKELRDAYTGELSLGAADLLTVAEARSWLALGEAGPGRRALARLAGVSGPIGREAELIRLEAALVDAYTDRDELAQATLRALQGPLWRCLDAPHATGVMRRAAERLDEVGLHALALRAAASAERSSAQLLSSVAAQDQGPLSQRLAARAASSAPTRPVAQDR